MRNKILKNLELVHNRIAKATKRANRESEDIKLLLATKTVSIENIVTALRSGENLIGENKVQELKTKCPVLKSENPEVHFIGHLQSNKIKEVIKWASCIQSIDNHETAIKLNKRLIFDQKSIDVLIQVNTSNEESKFGVDPDECIPLVKSIAMLSNVRIKGLMTIGKFGAGDLETRQYFNQLRSLSESIKKMKLPNVKMDELSMGMSGDLEIAIQEGATIIRVGTAIFGDRVYPDSYYWNEEK